MENVQMPKYRKNPEIFEAVLFTGGEDNAVEIVKWLRDHGMEDATWRKAYPETEDNEYIELGRNTRRNIPKHYWVVMNDEETFDVFTKEEFEKKYSLTENWDETVFNLNKHAFLREVLPMDDVYNLNKLREAVGLPTPDALKQTPAVNISITNNGVCEETNAVSAYPEFPTVAWDGSMSGFVFLNENREFSDARITPVELPMPDTRVFLDYLMGKSPKKIFEQIFMEMYQPPKKDVPSEEPTTFTTEIEALQYSGTDHSAMGIVRWVNRSGGIAKYVDGVLTIRKLYHSAVHIVKEGQWVIRMPADGAMGVMTDEDMQQHYLAKVDAETGPVDEGHVGIEKELERLINRYSGESVSGTPDFILAKFLIETLKNYNEAVSRRAEWRGETCEFKP